MQQPKPIGVIILAAGSIKHKYNSFSFIYNSPALVPIASRSTISFILDNYAEADYKVYIAINKEDEDIFKKELIYYNHFSLVTINLTANVCDTLSQVIAHVSEEDLIINLATTIPTAIPSVNTVLIDNKVSNHNFYSGVSFKNKDFFFKIKDQENGYSFNAFIGIFRCNKNDLTNALGKLTSGNDLLYVVIKLNDIRPFQFVMTDWIDTGHEINYADARTKLISSRTFNAITLDSDTGILTKKSANKKKLYQEVKYIEMLPSELQIKYPRILHSDYAGGVVKMEYYGYPNLAEYQLYRELGEVWWERIFQNLINCLQSMRQYSFSIGQAAFENFYFHKTLKRTEDYLTSLPDEDIFKCAETFVINDLVCGNFHFLKDEIAKRIAALYEESDFCVMHGDFCFNNILFDAVSNTLKLIDPRGSFGDNCEGIYGDRKYDLAKLMHSTVGYYDYIVNNLFQLEQKDNKICYSFPLRDNQPILEKLSSKLLAQMNIKKEDILFITGLIFLSMCPFHSDNAQRQRLMFAHGLFFINKYI